VAAGFLDIDVLARGAGEDRGGRVPEIRRGDRERIDAFVFENFAHVFHALHFGLLPLLHRLDSLRKPAFIDLADIRDLDIGHVEKAIDVRHAAAEPHDRDADFAGG
jgi:hypothetical protein